MYKCAAAAPRRGPRAHLLSLSLSLSLCVCLPPPPYSTCQEPSVQRAARSAQRAARLDDLSLLEPLKNLMALFVGYELLHLFQALADLEL